MMEIGDENSNSAVFTSGNDGMQGAPISVMMYMGETL